MRSALDFLSELDAETVRQVHSGDVTRTVLSHMADEAGFPQTAGENAHRLIRAHKKNLEAFIAFYLDGVSHAMDAADAPEVEGNVANVTVRYPHGRPVRGLDQLMREHGEDPGEWEVESLEVNEWPTTMSGDSGPIYVNNFQAKARLSRKTREPQYKRVQPVSVDAPEPPDVQPLEKRRPDGWQTALVLMDRQTGHRRSQQSWTYETIHDREAVDLAVQVAALAKPEVIVDVGDVLDFAGVSSYTGTPDLKRSLQPAICEAAYDNARLRGAAEAEAFHILEGNHDERLNEKLLEDAQEMYQLREAEALTGKIREIPADGSLLPETYEYSRGHTRARMINRMQAAMDRLLDELWPQRDPNLPVDTRREAVTLASIVEKETGVPDERAVVAGVFVNRLRQGMRLQSDPTVRYALTGGEKTLDRPLTRADLELDDPYNTYTNHGLPPGPIANPGRAAIEAALNPADTDYLYFVADGDGGHVFAETLEAHNENVAEYRAQQGSD